MRFYIVLFIILLSNSLTIGQNVGVNTPNPEGTVHISGQSSIMFPNLRITDTVDNFARIKMETSVGVDRFWDIAAGTTNPYKTMNFYFQEDTLAANIFQITPYGLLKHRSLNSNVYSQYYANEFDYQGFTGFSSGNLHLSSNTPNGKVYFATRSITKMTLDTMGRLGLGIQSPKYLADFRSKGNDSTGALLQLSTPTETNFLRFFGGSQGDAHPHIAFHEQDTFHLGTSSIDPSNYTRRLTMLPNGFIGLGTDTPSAELDIMSSDADDGVKINLSNLDTTHFLRLYSGRQNLPKPIMFWRQGDVLELGMSDPDENNYQQFLSFDGKTIGVHNTGESIFIGEGAGTMESGFDLANVAIGQNAMSSMTFGQRNIAIGKESLLSNTDGSENISIGYMALMEKTGNANIAIGGRALALNAGGSLNIAIGSRAMESAIGEYNIGIGDRVLEHCESNHNIGIGFRTLNAIVTGYENTAVGEGAMRDKVSGNYNVAIGKGAMRFDLSGEKNVSIGSNAMRNNLDGDNNTIIGDNAGAGGTSYYGNVMIGHEAGYNEVNSHRLYIDNTSTPAPLIYGEFDNNLIRINGRQEITGDLSLGTAFYIDQSAKRIGVNTVAPSYTLDVNGTVNFNKNITSGVAMRVNGDEALWYDESYFSWGFGADHNYFGRPMTIGPFEGSTTPFAQLHVVDDGFTYLQVESHNGDAILQLSGNTNAPSIGWTMRRDASDGGKLQWRHDDFSKMTMTPGGNLGVGPSSTNPTYTLYVNGDAGKPGGGSWTNSSDRRLKQNIKNYEDGLAEIQKIRPVTFQYNEISGYDTSQEYVGVIAQELQEVAPYMVSENEKGYLDVNNSAMTYMLVNALQKQQEFILALQKDNDELRTRLEALENYMTASVDKE